MRARTTLLLILALLTFSPGCGDVDTDEPNPYQDKQDSSFMAGKADAFGFSETSPQAAAVLLIVNAAPYEVLAVEAAIDKRAVEGIIAHRDGPDGAYDTEDDDVFESLVELDTVEWFGPEAFRALIAYAEREGLLEPSVIGGQSEGGYPSTGYVQKNGRMLCTMVLVEPDVVLTAAHCVNEMAIYSIGFGEYSIFNRAWIAEDVFIHPEYNAVTHRHDIAVLTLKEPVTDVVPANIGSVGQGCGYWSVGYGRSDEGLRSDIFSSWEWAKRKSVGQCVESTVLERVFVDGVNGAICWGDSGGPLFIEGTNTVVATLLGSMVARCQEDKTDVYVSLAAERDFVTAAMTGKCRRSGVVGTNAICDDAEPVSSSWIGTSCASGTTCDFSYGGNDAFCLERDGATEAGFCSVTCEGYCPDRSGNAPTFCVGTGSGNGFCVAKADAANSMCDDIPGTAATLADRWIGSSGASASTASVCLASE